MIIKPCSTWKVRPEIFHPEGIAWGLDYFSYFMLLFKWQTISIGESQRRFPPSLLPARKCHSEDSIIHSFLFAPTPTELQSKQRCGEVRARALAKRHAALIPRHTLCKFSPLMNKRKNFTMWCHIHPDQLSVNAIRASKSTTN